MLRSTACTRTDETLSNPSKTKALMVKMQSDMRSALSPENQTKFDANIARLKDRVSTGRAAKARTGRTARQGVGLRGSRGRPVRPPVDIPYP